MPDDNDRAPEDHSATNVETDEPPDDGEQDLEMLDDEEIGEILEEYAEQGDLQDLDEDVEADGGSFYSTFTLPALGFWDRNGHHSTVRIHGMSGHSDMDLAPDATGEPDAEDIEQVVIDCVDRIGDYVEDHKIAEIIRNDLLVFDYYHIIFRLRQLSVGDAFDFEYECSDDNCNNTGAQTVSLEDVFYSVPEDPVPSARVDRETTVEMHGVEYTFHWHWYTQSDAQYIRRLRKYLKGRIEDRKRKQRRGQDTSEEDEDLDLTLIDIGLLSRIDAIETPDRGTIRLGREHERKSGDDVHMVDAIDVVRDLPTGIRMKAFQRFDREEPSHDTTVYYSCGACGNEMRVQLYPLDPNFFFPSEIRTG